MAAPFEEAASLALSPDRWTGGSYKDWIVARIAQVADQVWPRWDAGQGWVGKAAGNAVALTCADLNLMGRFAGTFLEGSRQGDGKRDNRWWFEAEDDLLATSWADRYAICFPGAPFPLSSFESAFRDGAGQLFAGSVPWLMKTSLQRPRANQTANWFGRGTVAVQQSISALSPSAISGHAFQGALGCLSAYLVCRPEGPYREELVKLAVDIGDRRVRAGIHYPSDNATSWYTAFELISHIARDADESAAMQGFLREAILSSEVYQAMTKSAAHSACIAMLKPWL
jgi:hypothetical protein